MVVNDDPAPWEMSREELLANWHKTFAKAPVNSLTPYEGERLPVGTWRMDPIDSHLERLTWVDPRKLVLTEGEADVLERVDYCLYVKWAREGIEPPPVDVVQHISGEWRSINRRRVMAAREAG